MPKLLIAFTLACAYFICSQIIRYFISPRGKSAKQSEEAPEEEPSPSPEQEDEHTGGPILPKDLFDEDEEDENE